jgi:meiosis-specific transcription factor NDT80
MLRIHVAPRVILQPDRISALLTKNSSSTSSTPMASGQRPVSLPTPATYNTRHFYSTNPPIYSRLDPNQRSPQFQGAVRRHPLSPTPSPSISYQSSLGSMRMDANPYTSGKGQANVPPLQNTVTHGQLFYFSPHSPQTPVDKIDIQGTIDKGFFLSDGEWTCYRRNYFSCICAFSLDPPNIHNLLIRYSPNGSVATYDVFDFAMTISAVVADSDLHTIDLVQHTPKRDKGPTSQPEMVKLSPKQPTPSQHPLGSIYTSAHRVVSGSMYGDFSQVQSSHPMEHTFERIQFKQATANNGKRRAAQQYYHLVVELHAHVGEIGRGSADQWMKIAQRKSAKMIVRGRSPGHYQSERRGSASSGPGGSSGTLGSYSGSQVPDYSSGSSILSPTYGAGSFDPRSTHYGSTRHHDMSLEPVMSAEQCKSIESTKGYQYYPGPIYEGNDPRDGNPCFPRNEQETIIPPLARSADIPISRLKHENDGSLPSICYPGPHHLGSGCNRFEGKSTSAGYYPIPQPT